MTGLKLLATSLVLVGGTLLPFRASYALENECSADFVSLDGASYLVKPSGDDDTENIECALNSAVNQGISTVKLHTGNFQVSSLEILNFEGSLQGLSKKATTLFIEDYTFDCTESKARPLVFKGGDVTIETMTIAVSDPCYEGEHFTLLSFMQISCEKRTHFANVDRVNFEGATIPESNTTAVSSFGTLDDSCENNGNGPLGTLKVNRSEISGFSTAVYSEVWAGGQVDINYNTITNVNGGIYIGNANQSTTITGNTIEYASKETSVNYGYTFGVAIESWQPYAPTKNRTVIHSNIFTQGDYYTFAEDGSTISLGIWVSPYNGLRPSHAIVISDNTLNTHEILEDQADVWGMFIGDTDAPTISGNRFRGSGTYGVVVGAYTTGTPTNSGTITGNSFANASYIWGDIVLGELSQNIIVGPGSAYVRDISGNNFDLSNL